MDNRIASRYADDALNIPFKANRVLNIILVAAILILLRCWHLAVIQYEEKLAEASKPQRRVVLEPAKRATIRDRFNIPLAINKVQYNVALLYSQIKQIPAVVNEIGSDGKRVKKFKRKEYIAALSCVLADELDMDAERIADLIHAKAIFYHQIPFVLKEDISEKQYYKLKMMEKDWLGICVQRVPRRSYPMGKVAGDIIGYIGPLNRQEYEAIVHEIKELETYVEAAEAGDLLPLPKNVETIEDVQHRLEELRNLAYNMNDAIGKAGIEGKFERSLRGYHGKKSYYSDARGNFLRELPGSKEPQAGKRLLLTISAELQEYAEKLLIQNEQVRQTKLSRLEGAKKTISADKSPWIKGGSIVALDPNNGEIIAMASHPRYNPNDFIPSNPPEKNEERKNNLLNWLESETFLAHIWERKLPLSRELFNKNRGIYLEQLPLTWSNYLQLILSVNSPLKLAGVLHYTVRDAVLIQNHFEEFLEKAPNHSPQELLQALYQTHKPDKELTLDSAALQRYKEVLDPYLSGISAAYDQLLLIDLMRVAVNGRAFSEQLLQQVGDQTLQEYRELSGAATLMLEIVKKMAKELFHAQQFQEWRKLNEKEYLKNARKQEKEENKHPKPYIEILDSLENRMFQEFWQQMRWKFILALVQNYSENGELSAYFEHFNTWHSEIAHGAHQKVEWIGAFWKLFHALKSSDSERAMHYLQTMRSYQELDRPLLGKYRALRKDVNNRQLEKHLAAAFYPKYGYGYGRSYAYRQSATQGSIFKMITAYEGLVQRYQKLLAEGVDPNQADLHALNPLEMVDQVYYKGKNLFVGYGADGTPLGRHYKGGRLPRSIGQANGKLDILKAIEVSSNPYFSLLAGDIFRTPQDLALTAQQFSFGQRTGIDLPGELQATYPMTCNRTALDYMPLPLDSILW